jgi:uncharacterized alpha-E superfamily protein
MPTSAVAAAPLLSRVADALYWIGRYLERAENAARLLDVHSNRSADGAAEASDWSQLIELARDGMEYPANWPRDEASVARFVVHYPGNPNSIVSTLTMARENARGVRGTISSEMWEQINSLHWAVRQEVEAGKWATHPHVFLQSVKQGAHLFHGLAEETMLQDESDTFIRLGKCFERTVNTLRLVEVKHGTLTAADGHPDLLRCAATLKMCSAVEACRRWDAAPVERRRVVEFLLLNAHFPRSALWSATRAAEDARAIAVHSPAAREVERQFGALRAQLEYADVDELLGGGLPEFLVSARERAWAAERALHGSFFLRDDRPVYPGRSSFPPLQQQQQQQQ